MKKTSFHSIIALLLIIGGIGLEARPILERNISHCRRDLAGNVRCANVYKSACTINGESGWCINCSERGSTICDRQVSPTGDLDMIDATSASSLLEFVDEQLNLENPNGTHTIQVQEPGGQLRIYTVIWNGFISDDEVSASITVSRVQ